MGKVELERDLSGQHALNEEDLEGTKSLGVPGAAAEGGTPKARSRASSVINVTVEEKEEGKDAKNVEISLNPGDMEDLGRLGEGAGGEVRKSRHKPTGLVMAKKTIPASPNPAIHRQILRELSFNRECNNAYICRYYGAFLEENDTQIAIFMEFCEGGSFDAISNRIKAMGARAGEKVLGKVAEAVLGGLVYLHSRKIIHRDIKPSNILVTRKGEMKLADFGVSGELVNSLAGTFTGTSYYMAPERIRGAKYTINSDVWSLGLTLLELAMNRFPFPPEGEPPLGPIELLTYIVKMEVPKLEDNEAEGVKWTKYIRDFINVCLEKDPANRPTPQRLLTHPWIKRSEAKPNDFLEGWLKSIWGWE
ncbi:Pkinase-domain-containing protein [Atractiella rhizophila]|nr:Pkinase-domain-containing protein [Atractiella rhizophila]